MDLPFGFKRLLREHAVEGRLRPIAAPVHSALVGCCLRVERILDALEPSPQSPPVVDNLTALIKAFERPYALRRLVASVKRFYPALPIVVVDDSREPASVDGVRTVVLPYDTGISEGRNQGLRHVETPYVLVLDDDFVFFRHTRLAPALALMEANPGIDIMGGEVIDLPLFRKQRMHEAGLFRTSAVARVPIGSSVGGLRVCAKVPNFFIARAARLALIPWDPRLKRMEHADFFTRALGVLTTVFNPALKCLHAPTPFDAAYMKKRMDLADDARLLEERYGLWR
jgi:hypothetical protein